MPGDADKMWKKRLALDGDAFVEMYTKTIL